MADDDSDEQGDVDEITFEQQAKITEKTLDEIRHLKKDLQMSVKEKKVMIKNL